jgi:hypothetical protein
MVWSSGPYTMRTLLVLYHLSRDSRAFKLLPEQVTWAKAMLILEPRHIASNHEGISAECRVSNVTDCKVPHNRIYRTNIVP